MLGVLIKGDVIIASVRVWPFVSVHISMGVYMYVYQAYRPRQVDECLHPTLYCSYVYLSADGQHSSLDRL